MVLTFAYSSKLLICVSAIIQSSKNVAASGTYFNRLDKKEDIIQLRDILFGIEVFS